MMHRRKTLRHRAHSELRLPDDVEQAVNDVVQSTGWSPSASVSFLCRTGIAALSGKSDDRLANLRRLHAAAREHHRVEASTRRELTEAAVKLREARRSAGLLATPQTAQVRRRKEVAHARRRASS